MICDLHVHLVGFAEEDPGNFVSSRLHGGFGARLLTRRFNLTWPTGSPRNADATIANQTLRWLDASQIDRAVLLALDAAYTDEGIRDERKTLLTTSNEFVAEVASRSPKACFGASIHPYRADALGALEHAVKQGAVLMKWLPGAQNICPDDPRCIAMYEALAHYRLPLLSHTGSEHLLKGFPNSFNDPVRLIPALERGVTVIAAHCGTRLLSLIHI